MPSTEYNDSSTEKYKMTFRNSFGAWVIAILLYYPFRLVLAGIFIFGSSAFGIEHTDRVMENIENIVTILAFVGVLATGNRLAYWFWKRKHQA